MDIRKKTLRYLFDYCTTTFAQNRSFCSIDGTEYSYKEFGEKTREVASLLAKYGIKAGDKVGILSQNMPNWPIAYFSVTAFGMIAVPMLPDFSESDVKHILKHSECKALFVSNRLYPKVLEKARGRVSLIINIETFEVYRGEPTNEEVSLLEADRINTEDLVAIIYTSGTTGNSKGVMLSNKNLCANLYSNMELRPSFEWDVWLSLLPLPHTYESSLGMLLPMTAGASVYYLDKLPTPNILMAALKKIHPTTMLAVPLIIEKIYKNGVLPKIAKNKITNILYRTSLGRKLIHRKAGKELFNKFGGNIRFLGIGGAKLDANVERFLYEGKFPYAIGYGMTEASPLIAGSTTSTVKLQSTGPACAGVTLIIDSPNPFTGEGEIMVKGDNIMMGYYKNPEATASALTDNGWLKTKDLGLIDKKGRLFIKGRLNNTIIGPSGENIYPEDIEVVINSHDLVEESIVTEDRGRLTAIVHFNQEKLKSLINTKDDLKQSAQEKIENLKKELMDYVNQKVNKFSKISNVDPQDEAFEKTATHKIKRYLYTKKYIDKKEAKKTRN